MINTLAYHRVILDEIEGRLRDYVPESQCLISILFSLSDELRLQFRKALMALMSATPTYDMPNNKTYGRFMRK